MSFNQFIDENIRYAKPEDAKDITQAFNDEYVEYYGMYVDPDQLAEEIDKMESQIIKGEQPKEFIRTVENSETGEFVGVGALKMKGSRAELGSTIINQDDRGAKASNGNTLYSELFTDRFDAARHMVEDPTEPLDIVYTQLLADKSAATQHVADKNDFAVTAIYNRKFPVAYEGKGRVTVVDMVWADSHIENDQHTVYAPKSAAEVVETSQKNINRKRSNDRAPITREIQNAGEAAASNYSVDVDGVEDPMFFKEVTVVPDENGEHTLEEVFDRIEDAEASIQTPEDEEYKGWVGVSIDVNSPQAITLGQQLEEIGMVPVGFNPGKIKYDGERRDSLEFQYNFDKKTQKQFIREAAEYIANSGITFEESELNTDYDNSVFLRV